MNYGRLSSSLILNISDATQRVFAVSTRISGLLWIRSSYYEHLVRRTLPGRRSPGRHRPPSGLQDPQSAPARTRRAAAAREFTRRILTDVGGAVPLHAFDGLRRWRRRNRAITELGALNNRMLRDIGIDRSHIQETVDAMLQAETEARTS